MSGVHDIGIDQLPETLPIFPLNGVLLLPRGRLPLNVFEPRYLTMTEEALGRGRFIGVMQPRAPEADPISDTAPVYDLGCAGRIVSFAETDDGRYLIALLGVCRFRVIAEQPLYRGFRQVNADFHPFIGDLEEPRGAIGDRPRMLSAVRQYLALKEIAADWEAIEEADDESLVTTLAMICPFEPREKQALLECADLSERSQLLASLMEMSVREAEATPSTARH